MRWSWAGLALLAACSGDGGTDEGGSDAATTEPATGCAADLSVEIGTGALAYEPLEDGDTVTIVHGPQGGWHIETGAIVSATAQEVSILPRIVVPSLGDVQIGGDQQPQFQALTLYDAAVCSGQFYGVRAFVDDLEPPPDGLTYQEFICSLEGLELEFSVEVSELGADGIGSDSVTVVAALDSSDVPVCQ